MHSDDCFNTRLDKQDRIVNRVIIAIMCQIIIYRSLIYHCTIDALFRNACVHIHVHQIYDGKICDV